MKRLKVPLVIDNATSYKTVVLKCVNLLSATQHNKSAPTFGCRNIQILQGSLQLPSRVALRSYIDCVDNGQSLKVNMRDTVCMVKRAWDAVSPETISNYWKLVGLFSDAEEPTATGKSEQEDEAVMTALENAGE